MSGQSFVSGRQLTKLISTSADASGAAAVTGPVVEQGHAHVVTRVKISAASTAPGTCEMFDGDPMPGGYIDGSASAVDDTWTEAGYVLASGSYLTLVFAALDPLCSVRVRISYTDVAVTFTSPDQTMARY